MNRSIAVSIVLLVVVGAAGNLQANERSRELTLRAYDEAYNLDYAAAVKLLTEAIAADPEDAGAHRAMAVAAWLRIGFLRGSVTVDDYLGNVTKPNINMTPPPAAEAERFRQHITRALELAEATLKAQPSNPEAHFAVGSIVGIQASYGATVEGKILSSFRLAKRAYDAHERVLKLAPQRKDAGLIVGSYRYIVSALSLPVRLMAYVAGFGGGRERGLRLIEEAASMPGETQVEAKFALLLLYNRERRFEDAMAVVRELQQRFPRNRLLWLEGGATLIRAARFDEAVSTLDEGLKRLGGDAREQMFGEIALWRYKRGLANVRLRRSDAARADLTAALAGPAREWVLGRSRAELGRLADLAGQREQARAEYRLAIELAERGNDPVGKQEAEALLRR